MLAKDDKGLTCGSGGSIHLGSCQKHTYIVAQRIGFTTQLFSCSDVFFNLLTSERVVISFFQGFSPLFFLLPVFALSVSVNQINEGCVYFFVKT